MLKVVSRLNQELEEQRKLDQRYVSKCQLNIVIC